MLRKHVRTLARLVLRTDNVTDTLRRRKLALSRRLHRRPIDLNEVRALLSALGFARGRVVWVQSSWNEFYNFRGRPTDVLGLMQEMLGATGTLVMPAFPIDQSPEKVLEIDAVPSSSGLLTELFRRQSSVDRSIHLTSSVCASGPASDYLVRDHHRDRFPWGRLSPFCRLMDVEARLVCLGLGRFVTSLTPLHAVECLLYDEVPFFRQIFQGTIRYRWRRRSGETGENEFLCRTGRLKMRGYGKHFSRASYVERRLSNLDAYAIDAKTAIERAVVLGRGGTTIYVEPAPRRDLFPRNLEQMHERG